MAWSKEKLLRLSERVLKRTDFYLQKRELADDPQDNFKTEYVLVKGRIDAPEKVIAYASDNETMILFHPLEERASSKAFYDWSFDFESDLFKYLEQDYQLIGMSPDCHVAVWHFISEYHQDEIEHLLGMQMYLEYCKRNHVTKGLLQQRCEYNGVDVMTLYHINVPKTKDPKDQSR